MANDFSGDSNCVALYNVESGALTTDSKGSNTLANQNSVGEDTTNYWQGSCSAIFNDASSECFYITDANKSADHPFKNGVSSDFSISSWFVIDDTSHNFCIVGQYTASSGLRTFEIIAANGDLTIAIGYNSGDSYELLVDAGYSLVAGRAYHIGFTYEVSSKNWKVRLWDDTSGSIVFNDSGTATNSIYISSGDFCIGARNRTANQLYLDGNTDETVIFKDILTTDEIDQIRAGTYGAGGTTIPVFMRTYRNMRNC